MYRLRVNVNQSQTFGQRGAGRLRDTSIQHLTVYVLCHLLHTP